MSQPNETGRAWDPLVRITHWGIAAAVILNGLILEGGEQVHIWLGYAALALLSLRLVWGVVGTEEARFSAFPPSPGRALGHLRDMLAGRPGPHRSHNPLGALMVYALWTALAIVVATGLAMESEVFPERDEAHASLVLQRDMPATRLILTDADEDEEEEDDDGGEGEEALEELHEAAANALLFLALLHVGGVVFEMMRGDRGLIRRMTFGQRAQ